MCVEHAVNYNCYYRKGTSAITTFTELSQKLQFEAAGFGGYYDSDDQCWSGCVQCDRVEPLKCHKDIRCFHEGTDKTAQCACLRC